MANEEIPNLFQEKFGGKIYTQQRDKRKKTWSWMLATNPGPCIDFVEAISKHCIVKGEQLLKLRCYLEQTRKEKRQNRYEFIRAISNLKEPPTTSNSRIWISPDIIPDRDFFKWLAGFLDGDGNLCVYEYKGIFYSRIGIFNIFPSAIITTARRIKGSITISTGCNFPVWKWICCQKDSEFACESLLPHLVIKKEQCKLLIEFLNIKKTKIRDQSYSFDQVNQIREIINQIKHLNSL
jgi:hypothetical protein